MTNRNFELQGPDEAVLKGENPNDEIDRIFNDAKFIELLDNQGLELDRDRPEEAKKYYEAFKKKDETARALKDLYSKEISADTKGQIKLGPEGQGAIDKYLESLVASAPERILEMLEEVKRLKDLNVEVVAKEEEVKLLGQTKEQLAKEISKEQRGIKSRDKDFEKRQKELKSKKGISSAWAFCRELTREGITGLNDAQERIAELKGKQGVHKELESIKRDLNNIREELFGNGELGKLITEAVAKDVQTYFAKDSSTFSIEELEKSLEMAERLQELDDDYETPTLDYMKSIKSSDTASERPKSVLERLDKEFVIKMKDLIIAEFTKGIPTLDKVNKSLTNFSEKRKAIGSHRGQEPKAILQKLLSDMLNEGVVESLPAGKRTVFKDMAKKLKAT